MIVFKSIMTTEWNTKFAVAADYVYIWYTINYNRPHSTIHRVRENFAGVITRHDGVYCLRTGEDK